MNRPTVEHVRGRLNYDPFTGRFTWKTNKYPSKVGRETGAARSGYPKILIQGKLYGAHRLAWVIMTGAWAGEHIDHRNLNPLDNRWSNLRLATKSQNSQNTGLRSDNKSGFKGVCWDRNRMKWRSDIKLPHVRKHLGMFNDPREAHEAYVKAAKENYGEYWRAS